jgi:hypothetical protein
MAREVTTPRYHGVSILRYPYQEFSLPYAPSPLRLHVFRSVPHLSPRGPTATAMTAATRLLHVRKTTSSSATLHELPHAPASQRNPTPRHHLPHRQCPPHLLPCSPQHLSSHLRRGVMWEPLTVQQVLSNRCSNT